MAGLGQDEPGDAWAVFGGRMLARRVARHAGQMPWDTVTAEGEPERCFRQDIQRVFVSMG